MFNFLVSGNGDWWETTPLSSGLDRFKEYSGDEGAGIDAARPETLRQLEEIPTLLMYEVGAGGPHKNVVRYGRLRNIVRRGRELVFDFDLDPQHAYLQRQTVLSYAAQLGIAPFEQHRTHWAIKDGDLPLALVETGTPDRAERTIRIVAAEYVEARREQNRPGARELADELAEFPPTLEKALLLLPARILESPTPELYPILGIEPRTAEGRNALTAVLQRDVAAENLPPDWSFSLAWFLDLYGSPTEAARLAAVVDQSATSLAALGAEPASDVEEIAYALWRCSRCHLLVGQLRREIAMALHRLARRQTQAGCWTVTRAQGDVAGVRATALATVALQRLGDDRYHAQIRSAVDWLIEQRSADTGAFARDHGEDNPDVIATILAMEAIRRSDVAEDIEHVLDAGDAWLVAGQTVVGGWVAEPWSEDFVAASVLGYLAHRATMLPQVDGFLLMARDFFLKAEELRLEGGANNRRLAAIATVHSLEMFLYGVFDKREDLALSAFKENGTETLGPREALRGLQEALQRIGVLAAPQRLPFRDNLSSLIGRRDGIIHRAHEISEAELDQGIRHTRRFMTRFGKDLLNLDLLQ